MDPTRWALYQFSVGIYYNSTYRSYNPPVTHVFSSIHRGHFVLGYSLTRVDLESVFQQKSHGFEVKHIPSEMCWLGLEDASSLWTNGKENWFLHQNLVPGSSGCDLNILGDDKVTVKKLAYEYVYLNTIYVKYI